MALIDVVKWEVNDKRTVLSEGSIKRLNFTFLFTMLVGMTWGKPVLSSNLVLHLCINEIMQSNVNAVFEEMDFPDSWIELYNPTENDININRYCISPTSNYEDGYQIEADEVVPIGGYTLIWLDKKAEGKHMGFRLNSDKAGELFLFNERGELLDSISYPAMPAPNIAYARDTDGAKTWHHMVKPTPNTSNTGEKSDILLPQPSFSVAGHVMTESEMLTVCIPHDMVLPDDTRLFLTFNGDEPDTSAICVTGNDTTFVVDKTTVVRARLISSRALCPPSRTDSYVFHPRPTEIPIISLATNDSYLYSDTLGIFSSDTLSGNTRPNYAYNWRRPLNMEYLGTAGDTPLFNQLGETSMYGASTRSSAQKSMKLIANKRFGTKHLKGHFWPETKPKMKKVKAKCLRSCSSGSRLMEGLMQNWFGMHMPDLDYQAFSPAIVYINGVYKGFIGLREKSDEDYVWANYGGLEDIEMIESLLYNTSDSFKRISNAILSDAMTYEEASLHLDMDNMADMIAINTICANTDWPYNNVSMWCQNQGWDGWGKWRWIMKDMDVIGSTFRCTDPVKFNYLNYLTNTGEPGSQEKALHQTWTWIWKPIQLVGKIVAMPVFRELLVDRLMVFLGDFMRHDAIQIYLDEQYERLDTEITKSLMMLKTGGTKTFYNTIQKYIGFFRERQAEVYQHIADFYHLGYVIPMTTVGSGHPVIINGIPLTEGDFNGSCFSDYTIRLNSGDENTGWIMHISNNNNSVASYGFESPDINIIPKYYQDFGDESIVSIEFETCAIKEIAICIKNIIKQQGRHEISAIYTYDGKKASNNMVSTPHIIHYKDGHSKKVW